MFTPCWSSNQQDKPFFNFLKCIISLIPSKLICIQIRELNMLPCLMLNCWPLVSLKIFGLFCLSWVGFRHEIPRPWIQAWIDATVNFSGLNRKFYRQLLFDLYLNAFFVWTSASGRVRDKRCSTEKKTLNRNGSIKSHLNNKISIDTHRYHLKSVTDGFIFVLSRALSRKNESECTSLGWRM